MATLPPIRLLTPGSWGRAFGADVGTSVNHIPTPVAGAPACERLSTGYAHGCGITGNGDAYCWGDNAHGQLGDGTRTTRTAPERVFGDLRFTDISAGATSTCGVTTSGAAYRWGDEGASGGYTTTLPPTNTPSQVALPVGLVLVSDDVGQGPTCAFPDDGAGYCWGFLWTSETETGVPPTRLPETIRFRSFRAGFDFVCGVDVDSVAYCWRGVAGPPYELEGQR